MFVSEPGIHVEGPSTCDTLSKADQHKYRHACQTTASSSQDKRFRYTCHGPVMPRIRPVMSGYLREGAIPLLLYAFVGSLLLNLFLRGTCPSYSHLYLCDSQLLFLKKCEK